MGWLEDLGLGGIDPGAILNDIAGNFGFQGDLSGVINQVAGAIFPSSSPGRVQGVGGVAPPAQTWQPSQNTWQDTGGASGTWPAQQSGGTMDWTQLGVPQGMTLGGRRGLIPYSGGMIPTGYRVQNRPGRRGTPGYGPGVYLVPRRHMNPLNPRALLRAERRMASFTHWVKRHFSLVSHMPRRKKARRFGGARKRK